MTRTAAPKMRVARQEEVALMLDWAAAEGWNPGRDDAAAFHAADPQGFFLAECDGAPVAAISVVNHSDSFAFLGLYLCRPEWRGRGVGFSLWRHALTHAGGRTVGLDGVAEQQENYARSGFVLTGSTTRLEGMAAAPAPMRAATMDDLPALSALDKAANGIARPRFLSAWLAPCPTRRSVVLDGAQGPAGFATARLCREGCKVGPVVAPDLDAALALADAAAAAVGAERYIVDVPGPQPAFRAALEARGFAATFATARMYRGTPPESAPTLFAPATLELG
ncbi:GNAT family N-acetyltransferase [Salipiger abyssi]|uniref:Acetyltransferase (GNAT) domain-containing protein n=1 Tax=Salipiger abyssi TaxID=1250539 RepID=A0A1P8UQ06_9RHOB|nr:GNAT family N-acetyltransferase [Salipiger abyssi]APZ51486.1 Acetyltransferase (GNAT) domain-containing protein [Salipiger abyssi]